MDVIRETSFYALQCDNETLKSQAERQLHFANIWLNFVRKKKSTTISKYSITIPMWLIPGIHFLRHICGLPFTNHVDDEIFSAFYYNMKRAIYYLNNSNDNPSRNAEHLRLKPFRHAANSKCGRVYRGKKVLKLSRVEQLDRLDRHIDRRRYEDGLIGKIKCGNKGISISRKMEDDLASLKIRKFYKLNLLSIGQFATSKQTRLRGTKNCVTPAPCRVRTGDFLLRRETL